MAKAITERQKQVLGFVEAYIARHQYPPTVREIAAHFAVSSKAAHDHLKALERKGLVQCGSRQSRSISVTQTEDHSSSVRIPVIGHVAAGLPVLAEENFSETIDVPRGMLGSGKHFALEVRGDSMAGAGIMDGDMAIIRHQETATNGEIVVAAMDDGITLKRFYLEQNRVRLQAENPDYPPIFTSSLRVVGKLVSLIRKY